MVQINQVVITISIVLNIILASVLYSLIINEESTVPEIIFFERTEENKIELDRDDTVRLATFNIRTFGVTKMGKPEVVSELVEIFDRYDLVTVQEIKDINQEVPYRFLDELKNGSSEDWEMLLSERSGQQEDDIGGQEQYAVYYRNTAVHPVNDSKLYNDTLLDEFYREPFLTEFTVLTKNGELSNLTFLMLSIHTSPGVTVDELQSLSNLTMTFPESKKLVILGDMLELGSQTQKEHENILNLCIELEIDKIYTIGIRFTETSIEDDTIQKFESIEEFTKAFEKNKITFNGVLIKGSRSMQLENLIPFFESL